uniref:TFIIS central domain-containing protein n=1 Tax=Dunaliella tertiolecta TaxID=3047 RepID=A0A7S3VLX5_DUNTE|mmetsp:Transcript_11661/g.31798  ORF Transcript_11661/g.31798 Transcript_11661/m.31798 type:complete len:205 (+) Transcript_11661:15-629(+)
MPKRSPHLPELLSGKKKKKSEVSQEGPGSSSNADAALASAASADLLAKALVNPLEGLAEEVETELCKLHGCPSSREYKASIRNLLANLRRNEVLRANVCSRALSPYDLVRMAPKDLATEKHREVLQKTEDKMMSRCTMHSAAQGVATSDFQCPLEECKSRACSYVDAGRRDIGKSETWGAKDAEGKGRAVTCLTCGHKWEADMC